jgi:hypothetical protein
MINDFDKVSSGTIIKKNRVRSIPKTANEIHTIGDIVDDLQYLTASFPEAAIESALHRQVEMTPILLNFLNEVIDNYESVEDVYFGHLYALFLLAKFREKEAYPLVIKIMSLPDDWPENILGDIITEDLRNIVASLYNGDLTSIQAVIENPNLNTWSRNAALKTLLVFVKEKILEREEVVQYFKTLFEHPSFTDDMDAMTNLVNACCNLYPSELQGEIQSAFNKGIVDDFAVDMRWVKSVLSHSQEAALEKFLNKGDYSLINDNDIRSMKHWACFSERTEKNITSNFECHNHEKTSCNHEHVFTHIRTSPKIGRNDPCPCNSGKKYKKCCISTH